MSSNFNLTLGEVISFTILSIALDTMLKSNRARSSKRFYRSSKRNEVKEIKEEVVHVRTIKENLRQPKFIRQTILGKDVTVNITLRPDVLGLIRTSLNFITKDEYPITDVSYLKRSYGFDHRHNMLSNTHRYMVFDKARFDVANDFKLYNSKLERLPSFTLIPGKGEIDFRYDACNKDTKIKLDTYNSLGVHPNMENFEIKFDTSTLLNATFSGSLAIGTATALARFNLLCKESLENELAMLEIEDEDVESKIQVPVSKEEDERTKVLRTADSARFVYAHVDLYSDIYPDKKSLLKQMDFEEKGEHINGSQFWFKDIDGLPSLIRPMHFNNYVMHLSRLGKNFCMVNNFYRYGDENIWNLHLSDEYNSVLNNTRRINLDDSSAVKNDCSIIRASVGSITKQDFFIKNDLAGEVSKALKNKIIVTDFKRINVTISDYKDNKIQCPILESYIQDGYNILGVENDNEVLRDIFLNFQSRLIGKDAIKNRLKREKKGISLEERLQDSLFDIALGRRYKDGKLRDVQAVKQCDNLLSLNSSRIEDKFTILNGRIESTSERDHQYPKNSDYRCLSTYRDDETIYGGTINFERTLLYIPGLDGEEDFIETDEGYVICKSPIYKRILDEDGATYLDLSSTFSISLVKHTIIDTTDFLSSSEDVLYDPYSKLLIGKLYKDHDRTREAIKNNHHPFNIPTAISEPDSYRFEYYINYNSSHPKDVYMNVKSDILHLKAKYEHGKAEGIYLYKGNKIISRTDVKDFEIIGAYFDREDAIKFNEFEIVSLYKKYIMDKKKLDMDKKRLDYDYMKLDIDSESLKRKFEYETESLARKSEFELESLARKEVLEKMKIEASKPNAIDKTKAIGEAVGVADKVVNVGTKIFSIAKALI